MPCHMIQPFLFEAFETNYLPNYSKNYGLELLTGLEKILNAVFSFIT